MPGTNSKWTLREAAPALSLEAWDAQVADLFDESASPILDTASADLVALWYVAMSFHRLSLLPESPFSAPLARHTATEMLFPCAWADTGTTFAWWGEVCATRAELAAGGESSAEAGEPRESRERNARAELAETIHGRLFEGAKQWGWGVVEPVREHARAWIARRIDLLWSERARMEAEKGGR